jgi:hypothetical protein
MRLLVKRNYNIVVKVGAVLVKSDSRFRGKAHGEGGIRTLGTR